MLVHRLDLRLVRLPLVHFFETSFGRVYDRELVLVTLHGDGVEGWGECVAEKNPYISSETTETAWHIISEFLAPRVVGVQIAHPREIWARLAAVRGHHMAKAAVEMAAWDLAARLEGVPLHRLLGGTRTTIASGVSIGIQDSVDALLGKIESELAAGYQRIKIKIKQGWDLDIVAAVRTRFGRIPLMVDANAAYAPEDGDHLAELDAHDLMMIEQPLDYDDLTEHAKLQRRITTAICLDESIHSVARGADAMTAGACRVINIKPGRLGGHRESIRMHDEAARHGIPVWHGGMLETGIGRAHNIHLSTLPNFTLPGDIAASKRYFSPDLIEPGIEVSREGTVAVPDGPGIGVTIKMDRVAHATVRTATITEGSGLTAQGSRKE